VGVSVATLQDWEVDEDEPGPVTQGKLAAALGVSPQELGGGRSEAQAAGEQQAPPWPHGPR
jgi:hypothetical protein